MQYRIIVEGGAVIQLQVRIYQGTCEALGGAGGAVDRISGTADGEDGFAQSISLTCDSVFWHGASDDEGGRDHVIHQAFAAGAFPGRRHGEAAPYDNEGDGYT